MCAFRIETVQVFLNARLKIQRDTISIQIKGIAELYPEIKSNSKILHKFPMLNFSADLLRGLNFNNTETNAPYYTQIYAIDSIVFGNIKEITEKVTWEKKYILFCVD